MILQFKKGNEHSPRGHALIVARPYGSTRKASATYCIVYPIPFSIGRFIPPIIASQLGQNMQDMTTTTSFVPLPPLLEDVDDIDQLYALADLREDDLVEVDGIDLSNDMRRIELAGELCSEYAQKYFDALKSYPARTSVERLDDVPRISLDESTIESLMNETPSISDRDALGDIARSIGTLRYAVEGHNAGLVEETLRAMRRSAAPLGDKFKMDELIQSAQRLDPDGEHLTALYLDRAYKLADENYTAIPEIERQIKEISQPK